MGQVDEENAAVFERGNYSQVLRDITAAGFCPFCPQNLAEKHEQPILDESDFWMITPNQWPYEGAEHHILFIAKRHIERIEELTSDELAAFFGHYRSICQQYSIEGSTLLWRSGATKRTGASVVHLHAHLVVGKERTADSDSIVGLLGFK